MATSNTTLKNLVGSSFQRWTVIARAANTPRGQAKWTCRCDCGVTRAVCGSDLRSGKSASCGCYAADLNSEIKLKHGHSTRRKKTTTEYVIWGNMLGRCRNPKHPRYSDYGGRGITVCERWTTFANFLADMGPRPSGLTLERRNNNAGYSPDNCRWATRSDQSKNQRPRRLRDRCLKCGSAYSLMAGEKRCRPCRTAWERQRSRFRRMAAA